MKGNTLLSASQYAHSLRPEFPKKFIVPKLAKKYGVKGAVIEEMWKGNSNISMTFGNAIHYMMEQFFKHRENGCDEKEYHKPKHPFLRGVLDSFPDKDELIIPEVVVSCTEHKMAGRIDGLKQLEEKVIVPIDYKTDADIQKNIEYHVRQLSFYAFILEFFGYTVPHVEIYNYTDGWTLYKRDIIPYNPKAPKIQKMVKESWLKG